MSDNRKHSRRSVPPGRRAKGGSNIPKIKAKADARLEKTFETIGVPEPIPFKPDRFQLQALSAIDHGDCLVTAPTGAGKTWIAEKAIENIHRGGGRSWYASPLKALTNSKYIDFSSLFGPKNVGILTGDRKENPDAPIIVGTTEILRNQLYDAMHHGEDIPTDFVILDEAHFLGDEDRGVVWEEIMIYLPSRIPLLLLSATVGNAGQIAGWLESIRRRRCRVIEETERPVPLYPLFLHPSGKLYPLFAKDGNEKSTKLHKKVNDYANARRPPLFAPPRQLPPMGKILEVLREFNLLPAIFFLKSRADCDAAVELCREYEITDPHRREAIHARAEEMLKHNTHLESHRQLWHLENLAVASHHSGQLPTWKLVIEALMTDGLLDAVFATSTVAAGVNFPARTVTMLNSDRFNGVEFVPLNPTELHQMTGRAGRRGMDNIGFAVAIPGKYMDLRLIGNLFKMAPAPVLSQIKINFSMTLNLLLSHRPPEVKDLLHHSFATYLLSMGKKKSKKAQRKIENDPDQLWRHFTRHLEFLIASDYAKDTGELTEDGQWASQLRVDDPLMIAEGFRLGLFPDSSPPLMAAVIASFVNERETDDRMEKKLVPMALSKSFQRLKSGLQPFARRLIEAGFPPRPLFFRPALTMYLWASELLSWEEILNIGEQTEGDFAMLVYRTADNLRHIVSLTSIFPQAARSAESAIALILREPIAINYKEVYEAMAN